MMQLFLQKHTKKQNRGFTLVETLVALVVLIAGVTGALTAASTGIASGTLSRDQAIAVYLAEEGMERIRNIRDTNGIQGNGWLHGIAEDGDPCAFGNSCYVNLTDPPLVCPSEGCPIMKQDSNGFYNYTTGTDTIFTRTITLTQVNDHEVSIVVVVTWGKGLIQRQFRARENILNWAS